MDSNYSVLKNFPPSVDIVALNFNSKKYLPAFLKSIKSINYPKDKLHTFIIENNSYDGSRQFLIDYFNKNKDRNISLIQNDINEGFIANNIGMRISNADFILLLNIDTEIDANAIKTMIEVFLKDSKIGVSDARQVPHEHPKFYEALTRETSWCSGACMMLRKDALKQIGVFDKIFFMYLEDIDLSWRMWANGWKCVYVPEAKCIHHNFDPKDTKKPHDFEFYHVLRNGFFMRLIYGSIKDYFSFLLGIFWVAFRSKGHSKREKYLALKAIVPQFMNFPHLLRRRRELKRTKNKNSKWIKFYNIFDYNLLMEK